MSSPSNPYRLFSYKDENHIFIDCNEEIVRCSGHPKKDRIIGTTDINQPWQAYADIYHQHEVDVINGNVYSTLIPLKDHHGKANVFLHTKYAEYNEHGQFSRLVCHATELVNPRIHELTNLLSKSNNESRAVYAVGKTLENVDLTNRQQQCLFLFLHSKSVKQIAKILKLSERTIELHLDTIKQKLNCHNRSEIYDQAIALGFLNIIPSGMMFKKLLEGLKYE